MDEDIKNYNLTGFLDAGNAWEHIVHYKGNLLDVIAALNGWNPLEIHEQMKIHYGLQRYVIVRLEDKEN